MRLTLLVSPICAFIPNSMFLNYWYYLRGKLLVCINRWNLYFGWLTIDTNRQVRDHVIWQSEPATKHFLVRGALSKFKSSWCFPAKIHIPFFFLLGEKKRQYWTESLWYFSYIANFVGEIQQSVGYQHLKLLSKLASCVPCWAIKLNVRRIHELLRTCSNKRNKWQANSTLFKFGIFCFNRKDS
jgi:hypothetical protein